MDLSKLRVRYIDGYERAVQKEGMTQKDKILPYMTVVYPYRGSYEVALGDEPLRTLHSGEGCFITAPGAQHTIVHHLAPGQTEMVPRWLRLSVMYDDVLDVTAWFTPPFLVTGKAAEPFIRAVDALVAMKDGEENSFQKLRIAATVLEELLKISRFQPASLETNRIYPAILLVKDHYDEPITVERMAEACAMAPSTFYRVFRQSIQMTPMQYLEDYRLQQAAQLLLFEKQNLSRIAERCGYYDEFHLSRNFKRYYGVSPREYKKRAIL